MKDVKVISYIIPGKGRSENFKGTGGGSTTIINNVGGGSNSDTPAGSVQYAEEAGTAKYAEEAGTWPQMLLKLNTRSTQT